MLTRELATAINDSAATGRPEMRDYAIEVLRDSVGDPHPEAGQQEPLPGTKPSPLNPLALGIPLVAVGFFLALIFPPVGVALMFLGALAVGSGVVLAIVRSLRERFRGVKAS